MQTVSWSTFAFIYDAGDCVSFIDDDFDALEDGLGGNGEEVLELIKNLSHKLKGKGEMFLEDIIREDGFKCGEVITRSIHCVIKDNC